ncbi:MAG: helix-turn-helix domain-containing protein, partial [Proteobacteria bacterium]|nr:helix-turn-helix domain-containing protein [Pseudomonadota bacterium]
MGYGHSLDLRQRIIEAARSGSSARAAARRFGVSASSAINLVARWRNTGSYAPG